MNLKRKFNYKAFNQKLLKECFNLLWYPNLCSNPSTSLLLLLLQVQPYWAWLHFSLKPQFLLMIFLSKTLPSFLTFTFQSTFPFPSSSFPNSLFLFVIILHFFHSFLFFPLHLSYSTTSYVIYKFLFIIKI